MTTEYKTMVNKLLAEDSPVVFGNLSIDHAKHVITTLLSSAQKNVKILSGSLAEMFYNDPQINDAFEKAAKTIRKNDGIKIITTDEEDIANIAKIQSKINSINTRINSRTISYTPAIFEGNSTELYHFMVIDNKRYRLEDYHPKIKDDEVKNVKAEVCFNDELVAGKLSDSFEAIWDNLNK